MFYLLAVKKRFLHYPLDLNCPLWIRLKTEPWVTGYIAISNSKYIEQLMHMKYAKAHQHADSM